jgi:hypothetical protein
MGEFFALFLVSGSKFTKKLIISHYIVKIIMKIRVYLCKTIA